MAIISSTSNSQNHHECNKPTNMVAKASPLTPLLGVLGLVWLLVGDGVGDGLGFVWLLMGDGAVALLTTVSGSVAFLPHIEAMIT
jgi:hypothetical protein